MTPAEHRAWIAESRAAQGLPPYIDSPEIIDILLSADVAEDEAA